MKRWPFHEMKTRFLYFVKFKNISQNGRSLCILNTTFNRNFNNLFYHYKFNLNNYVK